MLAEFTYPSQPIYHNLITLTLFHYDANTYDPALVESFACCFTNHFLNVLTFAGNGLNPLLLFLSLPDTDRANLMRQADSKKGVNNEKVF